MAKKERLTEGQKVAQGILDNKALMARLAEPVKVLRESYKRLWRSEEDARVERFVAVRAILKAEPAITARALVLVMFGIEAFSASDSKPMATYTEGSVGRLLQLAGKVKHAKDGRVISTGIDYSRKDPETGKSLVTEAKVIEQLKEKGEAAVVNWARKAGHIPPAKPRTTGAEGGNISVQLQKLSGVSVMKTCSELFKQFVESHGITKENAPFVIETFNCLKPLHDGAQLILKRVAA